MKSNLIKRTAIAVGFVGSLLWGATCVLVNQNANAQVGRVFIINQLSNRCLDVAGDPGIANGARLTLADCELSGFTRSGRRTDQKWEFLSGGFIRNVLSNKCIAIAGDFPTTANGTSLILADCELSGFNRSGDITDQRWELKKWEYLGGEFIRKSGLNGLLDKCIDVVGDPGKANGTPLVLFDCEEYGFSKSGRITDQKWGFQTTF